MMGWDIWRPYQRPEWSGWKVAQNRNGYVYLLCNRRKRSITFQSYESARKRADRMNQTAVKDATK